MCEIHKLLISLVSLRCLKNGDFLILGFQRLRDFVQDIEFMRIFQAK